MSASRDSSGLVVQASDLLGTPVVALNLANGLVGEQLRTPYGQARFAASATTGGGMHTSFGFTGQREDTTAPGSSGLDYFNARYYDPTVGRFTSADPTRPDLGSSWGTDAYGYVGGAVENATDTSGLVDVDYEFRQGGLAKDVERDTYPGPYSTACDGPDGAPCDPTFQGQDPQGDNTQDNSPDGKAGVAAGAGAQVIDRGTFNNSVTASEEAKFEAGAINSSTPLPDYINSHVDPRPDKPKPTEPDKPKPGTSGSGQPPISNRPTQLGNCGCDGNDPSSVNVYRVQGGGSQERLFMTEDGGVRIQGRGYLHLNFDQWGRAIEFLGKREPEAYIFAFRVRAEFLDVVRGLAIDQEEKGDYLEARPQRDDPNQAPDQYGIPQSMFDWLLEYTIPGSAHIHERGDIC
jgi:RHS repeat-associated protein